MATQHRIDPRVRAYGKARIDITLRAKDEQEWQQKWKDPRYAFPFRFGDSWKHCVEYRVDDFAAEVGFFMDVLGFPVQTFSPSFAIFTSPGQDFFISVVSSPEGYFSTAPDAIRLQFKVENILETVEELERRGVVFEQRPQPNGHGGLITGYFRTPHGICIDLLGYPEPAGRPSARPRPEAPTPQPREAEEDGDGGEIDQMPLFSSPIEPDDPLFQYPTQPEENSGRRRPPAVPPVTRQNRPASGTQPPLPSSGERSSRLPTRDSEHRNGRALTPPWPGQFRRYSQGRSTTISRRGSFSVLTDSGPKTGRSEDQETALPANRHDVLPEARDVDATHLNEPEEPVAGRNGSQVYSRKGKKANAETRKLFEPLEEEPLALETEPQESEPEEELHYEDLDESDDYELPY